MQSDTIYDCGIIGGGLAGLSLAILLAKNGRNVALMEKNQYPTHKVCGEYISMESWDFLNSLGLNLDQLNLPYIQNINVSAHNGFTISSKLEMGGFGISRYFIENELYKIATSTGVKIFTQCNVQSIEKVEENLYKLSSSNTDVLCKIACGSYGKSNPKFSLKRPSEGKYLGVKYHIFIDFPDNLIELHNFENGYCGISRIEDGKTCLCYLTTSENLKKSNNNIKMMENEIIMKNPHLKKYFTEATFLYAKPLSISQIHFNYKSTFQNDMLLIGDAAGSIAPLCGNGMSMALRSSKIASEWIEKYLNNEISIHQLKKEYQNHWISVFILRVRIGAFLQRLFGKEKTTLFSLQFLHKFPKLFRWVISLTHGQPF